MLADQPLFKAQTREEMLLRIAEICSQEELEAFRSALEARVRSELQSGKWLLSLESKSGNAACKTSYRGLHVVVNDFF